MPQIFGLEHILYFIISIIFMTIGFMWISKNIKTEEEIRKTVRIIGLLLFAAIMWNRTSISLLRDGFNHFIPGTFCGFTSLILSLSAIFLKKNHLVFHCIAFVGLLGGTITLIYPDFIGQADSIFYPMTISGLVHHTIMVFLVVVMLMKGYLKPELKKWYILPFGLSLYMTYGLFLITVLGYDDAMYIYEPILKGTVMNWFVLGLMIMPYHFTFLYIWEKVAKQKKRILKEEVAA